MYLHVGIAAKKVFDEAQVMLEKIMQGGKLKARGVVGLFPAYAEGDDINMLDEEGSEVIGILHGLRQQVQH